MVAQFILYVDRDRAIGEKDHRHMRQGSVFHGDVNGTGRGLLALLSYGIYRVSAIRQHAFNGLATGIAQRVSRPSVALERDGNISRSSSLNIQNRDLDGVVGLTNGREF